MIKIKKTWTSDANCQNHSVTKDEAKKWYIHVKSNMSAETLFNDIKREGGVKTFSWTQKETRREKANFILGYLVFCPDFVAIFHLSFSLMSSFAVGSYLKSIYLSSDRENEAREKLRCKPFFGKILFFWAGKSSNVDWLFQAKTKIQKMAKIQTKLVWVWGKLEPTTMVS